MYKKSAYGQDNKWWDGYSQNNLDFVGNRRLPAGTYFYILTFDGDKSKTQSGFINIAW